MPAPRWEAPCHGAPGNSNAADRSARPQGTGSSMDSLFFAGWQGWHDRSSQGSSVCATGLNSIRHDAASQEDAGDSGTCAAGSWTRQASSDAVIAATAASEAVYLRRRDVWPDKVRARSLGLPKPRERWPLSAGEEWSDLEPPHHGPESGSSGCTAVGSRRANAIVRWALLLGG
jgi:hypothetical protein